MALAVQRKRRKASITSLIDVIFLLLLFFMLASTFSKFSEVEIATVASSSASSRPESEQNLIRLLLENNTTLIDGERLDDSALIAKLSRENSGDPLRITISVEETVATERLVNMLVSLNTIKGIQIKVIGDS